MNDKICYSKEELKSIQKIELETLKVFVDICNQNEIEFFLTGGSALGVVRHKGFIPWDDDIDVGMTRENYNRFMEVAPTCLPENYFLQTPYNDTNNPYGYCKIRAKGTEFVEYNNRDVKMHHGIYVDIFPYDRAASSLRKVKMEYARFRRWARLLVWRQSMDISVPPVGMMLKIKSIIRRAVYYLLRPVPYLFFINRIDSIATKHNDEFGRDWICYYDVPFTGNIPLVREDVLHPVQECLFEGVSVCICHDYDTFLKWRYGDYMQLPPEEKRFAHRPWSVKLDETEKRESYV